MVTMGRMGFALWMEGDTAWAAGTHEYRPMGLAVIAATDLFTPRDFRPANRFPQRRGRRFRGLFPSLGQLNDYLVKMRSQPIPGKVRSSSKYLESISYGRFSQLRE